MQNFDAAWQFNYREETSDIFLYAMDFWFILGLDIRWRLYWSESALSVSIYFQEILSPLDYWYGQGARLRLFPMILTSSSSRVSASRFTNISIWCVKNSTRHPSGFPEFSDEWDWRHFAWRFVLTDISLSLRSLIRLCGISRSIARQHKPPTFQCSDCDKLAHRRQHSAATAPEQSHTHLPSLSLVKKSASFSRRWLDVSLWFSVLIFTFRAAAARLTVALRSDANGSRFA